MPPEPQLLPLSITSVRDMPHLAWAEGKSFRLPAQMAFPLRSGESLELSGEQSPPAPAVADAVRSRVAFTDDLPVSSRLPFSYRLVPPWLRTLLASVVGRYQRHRQDRWAQFPAWPLDLSADLLEDWANARSSPWVGRPTPVVLSHDLDSAEGLSNLVRYFLDVEEEFGARSTNFVVPCAWPLDHGMLQEVARRGHEIGIHGYDHSNRTAFASPPERAERLHAGAELARRYGGTGYRAPSLLRTRLLLNDLSRYYVYDSSVPTSGGLFPAPNNGCATARPYRLGELVELPLSMPRDGSLLFLGYRPAEILDSWLACAQAVHSSGGVVVLLTHCEQRFSGRPAMRPIYRDFLAALDADPRFRWSTASEVVAESGLSRTKTSSLV